MLGKKIILTGVVGMVLLACTGKALGGTFSFRLSIGSRHHIAEPIAPRLRRSPFHNKHISIRPHQRTFLKRRPRPRKVVVVHPPRRRHIAVNLVPNITITKREVVVEPTTVTVWITNSNGSQTSVSLRKSGPGFIGPRGEWYPTMPTNEQLRVVYGF
jgi:hypothetical protein